MLILQTKRLNIRFVNADDAPFILRLLNDPAWLRFIGDRGVHTLEDAREYILNKMVNSYNQYGYGLYLTELKENQVPIGICGLVNRNTLENVDIGFAFLPEYRKKGFAYESANAVLKFTREKLHIEPIVAITTKENVCSVKLLIRLGFHYDKTITPGDNNDPVELYVTSKK